LSEPMAVLGVVALILFGKSLIAFLVVVVLGYPVSTGLMVSASLAQVGEFSFILAALGMSLGLLPPEGRDLIVARALLSITLHPLAFAAVELALKSRNPPGSIARFGRRRYQALERELVAVRQRTQQREHERVLRLHALVETFPLFSSLEDEDQEELLLLF